MSTALRGIRAHRGAPTRLAATAPPGAATAVAAGTRRMPDETASAHCDSYGSAGVARGNAAFDADWSAAASVPAAVSSREVAGDVCLAAGGDRMRCWTEPASEEPSRCPSATLSAQ